MGEVPAYDRINFARSGTPDLLVVGTSFIVLQNEMLHTSALI